MSSQNLSTQSTTPKLDTIALASKIRVEIPDDMVAKIKYLCRLIPKQEWSGVLFYEVVGTIRKVSEMKFILRDIFLMDKGTATYTSFDWTNDIVSYQMDNPETLEWTIGHIHSHNTMGVFFSGTDWGELNDNCPNHNFYLSVIVNNFMDITAKVAFTAEPPKDTTFVCKDEEGKDYKLKIQKTDVKPTMLVYDCEISLPQDEINVGQEFAERAKAIIDKAERVANKTPQYTGYNSYNQQQTKKEFYEDIVKNSLPDYTGKNNFKNKSSKKWKKKRGQKGGKNHMELGEMEQEMLNFEEELYEEADLTEDFAIFVLSLGNYPEEDVTLDDAIEDIEISRLNAMSLASSILESYAAYYDNFFDDVDDAYYKTSQGFMNVLLMVISLYEAEVEDHEVLKPVVSALKELGNKFEDHEKEKEALWKE